jgi:hypothetical protein
MADNVAGQAPHSLSDSNANKEQFEHERAEASASAKLNNDGRKLQNANAALSATPAENNCLDVEGQAPRSLSA